MGEAMWIEDTPVGFYQSVPVNVHARYVARRLWHAYMFRAHNGIETTSQQLRHFQGLMRKWELSWDEVMTACAKEGFEEAVAWWVARRLDGAQHVER